MQVCSERERRYKFKKIYHRIFSVCQHVREYVYLSVSMCLSLFLSVLVCLCFSLFLSLFLSLLLSLSACPSVPHQFYCLSVRLPASLSPCHDLFPLSLIFFFMSLSYLFITERVIDRKILLTNYTNRFSLYVTSFSIRTILIFCIAYLLSLSVSIHLSSSLLLVPVALTVLLVPLISLKNIP